MRRALLAAAIVGSVVSPVGADEGCVVQVSLTYRVADTTIRGSLDPATCGIEQGATLERFTVTLEAERRPALGDPESQEMTVDCDLGSVCAAEVVFPHPSVEQARYQGTFAYELSAWTPTGAQGRVGVATFGRTCTALLLVGIC